MLLKAPAGVGNGRPREKLRAVGPQNQSSFREVIGRGPDGPQPGSMKEMLVKLVKEVNEIPTVIRDIMVARADLEKKLSQGGDEEGLRAVRDNLANIDRELEWLRSRQTAAVATINLLSALIGAGRADDAQAVLAALVKGEQKSAQGDENESRRGNSTDQEELKVDTFAIKEVKPGKSESTIWAIGVTGDGAEYKICAKNGNGQALLGSSGKKAKIKYRPMGDDKLFAVSVEIAG